ncbi:hypothetical protein EDD18DRAFT_1107776 [Armillaria luteobubalina]|uniref:F-box domain-containing protein n=1 Tax=Armillaria luteobubalina TaxID=153913 RepID=A0AA39UL40_9AGAR|nr:hypothetical protein EDD18DRAFT_1107776 [Armillaria luteobubalina]
MSGETTCATHCQAFILPSSLHFALHFVYTKFSISTMTSTNTIQAPSAINIIPDELLLEIFAVGTLDTGGTNFPFLIAAVCHYWPSLAINDSSLWTHLTITPKMEVPSLSSDCPSDPCEIFPRAALILNHSMNRDINFKLLPYWGRSDSFMDSHFTVLSSLLTEHTHWIQLFTVTTNWCEITWLCKELAFLHMPQLQKWNIHNNRNLMHYHDWYNEQHPRPIEAILALAYPLTLESEPVPIQELKCSSTHLYPALRDVTLCGIPTAWLQFSASYLRKLVLEDYPLENKLLMQALHGILSNSKDTLETLNLTCALVVEGGLHNTSTFDFLALHKLMLQGPTKERDNWEIFNDMVKYLPLEQLDDLMLCNIRFHSFSRDRFPTPNHNLMRNVSIPEDTLPLLLQFICRLVHVHNLVLDHCCTMLLPYMNYANGGSINMPGLKMLKLNHPTENTYIGILPFLWERVELWTVDGEYIALVIEDMELVGLFNRGDNTKKYSKIAKHTTWISYCNRFP